MVSALVPVLEGSGKRNSFVIQRNVIRYVISDAEGQPIGSVKVKTDLC